MSDGRCIWDDCDQEAVYCAGHARELMQPEIDALAADRDRLAAELAEKKRWQEDAVLLCAKRSCAQRDRRVAELESELAQARADAERYRWLRDAASAGQWSYLEGCADDALDEQIDKWRAALSAEPVQQGE